MKYICKICEYGTNNKSNYNRHLKTKKHKNNSEINCGCGKKYKTRTGLWKHKKICNHGMKLKIMELEKQMQNIEQRSIIE